MKIIKSGYQKEPILTLTRTDMIIICNALCDYIKNNNYNEEFVEKVNGIRKILRTTINIYECGQPLIEQTMKLIEKHYMMSVKNNATN